MRELVRMSEMVLKAASLAGLRRMIELHIPEGFGADAGRVLETLLKAKKFTTKDGTGAWVLSLGLEDFWEVVTKDRENELSGAFWETHDKCKEALGEQEQPVLLSTSDRGEMLVWATKDGYQTHDGETILWEWSSALIRKIYTEQKEG